MISSRNKIKNEVFVVFDSNPGIYNDERLENTHKTVNVLGKLFIKEKQPLKTILYLKKKEKLKEKYCN